MRTLDLNYLVDIHETKSLTKTAENFYTSHQSVNNAIKALEKELNVDILNRTHRGITFTEAGEIVYQYACEVLEKKTQLESKLQPYSKEIIKSRTGMLDIFIIPRFSNKLFLKFYELFRKQNPFIKANLATISFPVFLRLMPFKKPTLILLTLDDEYLTELKLHSIADKYGLSLKIIQDYPLGICVSQTSKWYNIVKNSPNMISNCTLPVVCFNYAFENQRMIGEDAPLSNVCLIDNFEASKQIVQTGDYITLITPNEYEHFFKSKHGSLEFFPSSDTRFFYAALFPKEFKDDDSLSHFLECFKVIYCKKVL